METTTMAHFDKKIAQVGAPGQDQANTSNGLDYTPVGSPSISRALTVATARLNETVHGHVVKLASRHGSATAPAVRYVHFSNATARAVGLPKSDVTVIKALPLEDRALLALIRHGTASRIPQWAAQVEVEGGTKPHNSILTLAKAWAELEAKALRACGIDAVIAQAEALLALEVDHG